MMKNTTSALLLIVMALPTLAQQSPRPKMPRVPMMMASRVDAAETAVKQAADDLGRIRKRVETDIEVLVHIRGADNALTDPMQPTVAIEKSYEEIKAAKAAEDGKGFDPDFSVKNGLIKCMTAIESARLSPTTADFGHLRAVIRNEALGPASRRLVREATALSDQTAAWIRVQQQISDHLRSLGDLVAESLKAADQ